MKHALSILSAAFILASVSGVQADEMPMEGICTKGDATLKFGYASNYNDVGTEPDIKSPEIFLSQENYSILLDPILPPYITPAEDSEGYSIERLNGVNIGVKRIENGFLSVKVADQHVDEVVSALGSHDGWTCELKPAF